ncbi:acyl-CoA dehydrogenase family protein [Yunchengibacter salinarum]|uniref:acyl-CoA dehydrogenase family protein n=1 Tax=Yunchengibacter salinarum TaxID=3133399 RepID=UPI0035B63045
MMDFDTSRPVCPHMDHSHNAWRASVRAFVDNEIMPNIDTWEEAGGFPFDLHRKAADVGLIGLGYPEDLGGWTDGVDRFHGLIAAEELSRPGAGGLVAGLMTHGIGLPPVLALGSDAVKQAVAPPVLSGDRLIALAITEPDGGSDVAAIKTRARRDGDSYVVNGSKIYITSGMRAHWFTTVVRTGGPGAEGLSLLLIPADSDGVSRRDLKKQGWWVSDTAEIFFDDVRVPTENLLGAEGRGFAAAMRNFNGERLTMAAQALAFARVCLEEAARWAAERTTFGKPLNRHQVIAHKLADMARRIRVGTAFLDHVTHALNRAERDGTPEPAGDIALLKVEASQTMEFCAREAMQIIGGASYMRGGPIGRVERIYREVRVNAIGGGSEEIMKDLAARQLGLV